MLYAIYTNELGRVILHMATVRISGFNTYVTGYDDDDNQIDFVMDKMCHLDDYFSSDYGYCHIIAYIKDGARTECSLYQSLS